MIYLDNAATGGTKPHSVINATYAALNNCANAGRSGHKLSVACAQRVYACRKLLCTFFGGYSPDRVVFTQNCSYALNMAICGGLKAGDNVVTTVAEHNSVLRPLKHMEDLGVNVTYIGLNANGDIDVPKLIAAVNEGTTAVIITLASNVTGTAPDIVRIRSAIPKGVLLICDGAQACGHEHIDMTALGIDALAVAGHKGMCGIQGSGALIFSPRFNPLPLAYGGTGSVSNSLDMPDFYPDALECGTLSYPAIISLGEGAAYLTAHIYENRDKVIYLTSMFLEELGKIKGVRVYSRTNPYGIVAFSLDNMQSEIAAFKLSDEYSVMVRGGLHCAPLMHKALSSEGLVRVSLSSFNSKGDIAYAIHAISRLAAL